MTTQIKSRSTYFCIYGNSKRFKELYCWWKPVQPRVWLVETQLRHSQPPSNSRVQPNASTTRSWARRSGFHFRLYRQVFRGVMNYRETFNDAVCSSSEEDSNRADTTDRTAEQKTRDPVACRRHPFSVEALMSGWKTEGLRRDSSDCRPGSGAVSTLGVNSLLLCREMEYPPTGSRRNIAPSFRVKSEVSESEDCTTWVTNSTFSKQPRKFLQLNSEVTLLEYLHKRELLQNSKRCGHQYIKREELSGNPVYTHCLLILFDWFWLLFSA